MAMILVCDRDPAFVRGIEQLLTGEGYVVETVSRPADVLRHLHAGRFGAMILGLHLEEAEDAEAILLINRLDQRLPVIVIAADESLDLERRARRGRLFYYAVRPVNIEEIKEVISQALKVGSLEKG